MSGIRSHNVAYAIGVVCYAGAIGISIQSICLSQAFTYAQMNGINGGEASSWMLAAMYTSIESAIATPILTPLLWDDLAEAWFDFKNLPEKVKGFSQVGLSLIALIVAGIGIWAYYSDIVSVWGSLQLGEVSDVGYARGMTIAHVLGTEAFLLCGGISFWSGKRIEAKTANTRARQDYLIESAKIRKQTALTRVRTASNRSPSDTQKESEKNKSEKAKHENNGKVDPAVTSTWGAM